MYLVAVSDNVEDEMNESISRHIVENSGPGMGFTRIVSYTPKGVTTTVSGDLVDRVNTQFVWVVRSEINCSCSKSCEVPERT